MVFMKLVMQFIHLSFRTFKSFLPGGSYLVNTPFASLDYLQIGSEQAGAFHSMQQWIERAWSNPIAMVLKLRHHRKAEDALVRRVNEYMNSN
jgi:hypothetical protein